MTGPVYRLRGDRPTVPRHEPRAQDGGPVVGAPARGMAYGLGPWTAETLEQCRCGHLRGDHFRHGGQCLHSTDTETWACDCDSFHRA